MSHADVPALTHRLEHDFPGEPGDPVRRALALRRTAQASGEEEALATAEVLLDLRVDAPPVAAAVLLGSLQRGELEPDQITESVSAEVESLIAGVQRVQSIEWAHLEREATEKLRKMFLAMASDVRVVLIALADRVYRMRTLRGLPPAQQRALATETMEVYAPLANRLGIWQLKWELEDLAFRQLEPQTFQEIRSLLAEKRTSRTAFIERMKATLADKLEADGIEARVTGRPKHLYSIYKKMRRKGVGFDQIYDMSAVRIIVDRVPDCYAVLGMVHGLWTPIDGEFDDYIAKPKDNFYQSLHTAVLGPEERPIEIQIRTQQMHDFAEYGVAAHWRYKEGGRADKRFDQKIGWIRQLMEWQKEVTDPQDFAESLKTDVFQDQVYVFTPTGDVVDLPQGSTPLDFAYRIHTQVGHRCRGAKVGGQIVPLDYMLKTGDRVEVITQKHGSPSRDWLNPHMGYVRSSGAKQKIRQYFRLQERDKSIVAGRDLVERELKRLGLDAKRLDAAAALYPKYRNTEEFLAALGFGDISAASVAARLLEAERPKAEPTVPERDEPRDRGATVSIGGVDDVMSQPARCCNPVPGDNVVGFITRGRGLSIHRVDCPNVRRDHEPERWMDLDWGTKVGHAYPVGVEVVANDRAGLLRDIAEVVTAEGINMSAASVSTNPKDHTAMIRATLEIRDSKQVVRVLARLDRLPYVLSTQRVSQ